MSIERNRIICDYIILCEGKDALLFIIGFLNSETLSFDPRFSQNIQVLDFGGVDSLPVYLNNLMKMEGFGDVRRLLIIRDAETNVEKAKAMVKSALRKTGLPEPSDCNIWETDECLSTAFTLFPTCSRNSDIGALEDLCWEILSCNDLSQIHNSILSFINNIKKHFGTIGTHEHKSRLHTYFSINDRYVSLKIGEAAKAGAFDWSNKNLKPLMEIIKEGLM